jgi:hypothetical protein
MVFQLPSEAERGEAVAVRLLPSMNGWRRMMDSISAAAFSKGEGI